VTNNSKNQATGASGTVMQGQGVGTAASFSTATYPSTATGTGKILRADGTNWVASTATYPDTAGTSGNVLTSDGTNWSSSTPSSGSNVKGFLATDGTTTLADLTTYTFAQNGISTGTSNSVVWYNATTNFTLNNIYASFIVAGTTASAQNITFFVRVNNTTNTNITTTLQLTSATVNVSTSSFGLAINAGDYYSFGVTVPSLTTNPTNVGVAIGWSS